MSKVINEYGAGLVVAMAFLVGIVVGAISNNSKWQSEMITKELAIYHPQTGAFTWVYSGNVKK